MLLARIIKEGVEHKAAVHRKARYFSKKITINYFDSLYFDTFSLIETRKESLQNINSLPHYSAKRVHGKSMLDSNIAI